MDLDHAIRQHVEWKLNFQKAVRSGVPLFVEIVSSEDCCEFGRWLYGRAPRHYGHLHELHHAIEAHAVFHAHAGLVAQAINDRRHEDVSRLLHPGSEYARASDAVAESIGRLKRAISRSGVAEPQRLSP